MGSIDGQLQYFNPNTLDGLNPVSQEIISNALLIDGTNSMLADLDMNGHQIVNLQAGVAPNDAVNVGQFTSGLANYLPLTGGTLTGGLTIQANSPALQIKLAGGAATNLSTTDLAGSVRLTSPGNIVMQTSNSNNYSLLVGPTTRMELTAADIRAFNPLVMNSNKITSLANGTASTDAATYGQLTSGLANYLPLAGGTMSGPINMGSQKITSLANGTAPTDAAAYGQVTAVDANCVHLTGNETIAGIKTFTSSPIVPAQPTTLTQATSQKMMVGPRSCSWVGAFATLENPTLAPSFAALNTTRLVAYSPFELGNGNNITTANLGSSSHLNWLEVTSKYLHAGLPITGFILRTMNRRWMVYPGVQNTQYPVVECAIWDGTTGALIAQTGALSLRIDNAYMPAVNNEYYANFFLPIPTFTPTVSKRYVYGVHWLFLVDYLNNNNIRVVCPTNHLTTFQFAVNGGWVSEAVEQTCGYLGGIVTLPTNLTGLIFTPDSAGAFCCFLTADYSNVW